MGAYGLAEPEDVYDAAAIVVTEIKRLERMLAEKGIIDLPKKK